MVAVLVRDENAVDLLEVQADPVEGFIGPFPADPDVHQQMCVVGTRINTIAAASAGNTLKSHKNVSLSVFTSITVFLTVSFS